MSQNASTHSAEEASRTLDEGLDLSAARTGEKKAGVVDHIGCEWFAKRMIVASGRGA
jgi:hypothetical protein